MAASETGVEVVQHGGRDEIVIAQTQIFVALSVTAGVKRSEALGADVRHVAREVTAGDLVAFVDILVHPYGPLIGLLVIGTDVTDIEVRASAGSDGHYLLCGYKDRIRGLGNFVVWISLAGLS